MEENRSDFVTHDEFRAVAVSNVLLAILFGTALIALLLKFSTLRAPEIYALSFLVSLVGLYPLSRVWNRRRHREVPAMKYLAAAAGAAIVWAAVWHLLR